MADNTVRIRTTVKDDATKPLEGIRDSWKRLQKDGSQGLAIGAGATVAAAGFGLLDKAASGAVDAIVASIHAASDQREAMSLTQQVFEGSTESVKEWAKNSKDAFSATDALNFASQFGTAFKNVGMTLDETTAKAEAMTKLAGDLGSAFNTGSDEAALALKSGLLGESEPLRRFGVFLDEAKTKAKAAAMGLAPLGSALTDGQKVAARYALIMEQTADSQGMFGRDSESLADKTKILTSNVEDLQVALGEHLTPALVAATDAALVFMDALDGGPNSTSPSERVDAIDSVTAAYERFVPAIGNALRPLVDFARANVDAQDAASAAAAEGAQAWDTGSERIGAAFTTIGDKATDSATTVKRSLKKMVYWASQTRDDLDTIGSEVADALYDPIIAKAELARLKRERAEAQATRDSAKSTKAQVADAKDRIHELDKAIFEAQVTLIGHGKMSAKEQKAFLADLREKYKHSTGDAKLFIGQLIDKINDIPRQIGVTITMTTRNRTAENTGDHRAAGGPISPYGTALVGENGPEVIRLGSAGATVNPSASTGMGGGISVYLSLSTPLATPGSMQALAEYVVPVIAKELQRRQLIAPARR